MAIDCIDTSGGRQSARSTASVSNLWYAIHCLPNAYRIRHPLTFSCACNRPKLKRLNPDKQPEEEEKEDNRSFFAKYWHIIIPVVVVLLLGGSGGAEEANRSK